MFWIVRESLGLVSIAVLVVSLTMLTGGFVG